MASIHYRHDYAKFIISCTAEQWDHHYRALNEYSHQRKYASEWLKSHKVNRLWFNNINQTETWSIDIWGEWAAIVELLPVEWLQWLRRLDERAIVWDATKETVLDVGQHLQRTITSRNVHVYNTRNATKRLGRDRGGVGFAIGSHKSDLRISCYKRTGEPVAQEYQCSGAMLERLMGETYTIYKGSKGTVSAWYNLAQRIVRQGELRLARVLEAAGIGTYWPILSREDLPLLPPIQSAFLPELTDTRDDMPDQSDNDDSDDSIGPSA